MTEYLKNSVTVFTEPFRLKPVVVAVAYLGNVLSQLEAWLTSGNLQKLVLVVTSQPTGEMLERWVFDLQTDKSIGETGAT